MRTKSAWLAVIVLGALGWTCSHAIAATGSIRYHQFNDVVNAGVYHLTNSPKFPNLPDRIEYVTQFENPEGSGNNFDAYGAQFVGFVHPPVSGDYRFFIASDDQSVLYLSTDENPANKVLIAREPHWAGFREWTGSAANLRQMCVSSICENVSSFIRLESGRKYFVELLFMESGGDDHASVTWQMPGSPVPTNGSPPIAGEYLSPYDVPPTIPAAQPSDLTTLAGRLVTFRANITGSPRLNVQWYRDGQPIPEATEFSYSIRLDGCHTRDNGSTFYVVASNSFATITSRVATLTVMEDLSPPPVISASGSSHFDRVIVVFDEIMDATSVTDVFNYSLLDAQQRALDLIAAQTNRDGRSVTLFLEPPALLEPGQTYTIAVSGVADLCGNEIGHATLIFQSFVEGCAGITFEAFRQGETNVINPPLGSYSELFYRTNIPGFDSQLAFPSSFNERYEGRMRGVFVPSICGQWIFYLRSDDQSRLWFNPNGTHPAGKQLVQAEIGCCQAFEALPTTPFSLVGGRAYYIEALYREYIGQEYCQVAARLAGGTETLLPIGRRDLGQFALPGAAGVLTIVQQPQDLTVLENSLATFTVVATNGYGGPICYQWFKDGIEIVGATDASYPLQPNICHFEQAMFTVRLSIPGETILSAAAMLTVTEDASPPRVLWARGSETMREILVQFDELMDPTSAGDEFNYTVTNATGFPITVENAVRNPEGTSVTLSTAPQTPGVVYTVTVNGVTDTACRPHVIWGGTASFTAFPLVARIALSSNTVSLSWNSQMGRVYRIQFTDDLRASWTNLPCDILANGTRTLVTQPLNQSVRGRFYRVQATDSP